MIAPMPPALPSMSDLHVPNASIAVDYADEWPALWQQMLQARAVGPVSALAADMPLLHRTAGSGWRLSAQCSAEGAAFFALYKPLLDARLAPAAPAGARPWVLAQLGQSLDGCVATAAGDSYFVTGEQSLMHLHRLRALCDVVLVGAGTVAADDPQLTTRRVPGPQPVRAVLDPAARLDGRARVFRDGQAPTLWICDARHAAQARSRLSDTARATPCQAEVLAVNGLIDTADRTERHHPQRAVAALAARGLRLVFVEGGGITVSRFLAAGALDRLHLVVAPVLIGNGRRGLQGPARQAMADCPRPPARRLALGEDMLWDLELRAAPAPP
jgi:diaminohydroxyphosphoribosylaminopyrimidine deaminase / 5-amino-6-(5-phosphoribosylamino)uracil reductase